MGNNRSVGMLNMVIMLAAGIGVLLILLVIFLQHPSAPTPMQVPSSLPSSHSMAPNSSTVTKQVAVSIGKASVPANWTVTQAPQLLGTITVVSNPQKTWHHFPYPHVLFKQESDETDGMTTEFTKYIQQGFRQIACSIPLTGCKQLEKVTSANGMSVYTGVILATVKGKLDLITFEYLLDADQQTSKTTVANILASFTYN